VDTDGSIMNLLSHSLRSHSQSGINSAWDYRARTGNQSRRKILRAACCLWPAMVLDTNLSSAQVQKVENHGTLLTTDTRKALAVMLFKTGFHCSQCVLEVYADDFGLDPEMARRMAAALAGGSSVGGECGAIGSGYLVLGLKYGRIMPTHGDVEREKELWSRVELLVSEFKRRHGAITCHGLLGVDVFTKEGREKALERNLFNTRCPNHIQDVIDIIDSV